MAKRIPLRELSEQEQHVLTRLSHSRKEASALVRRARIILGYYEGQSCRHLAEQLQLDDETVRLWVHRFQQRGLDGLRDAPRSGRPAVYSLDEVSLVIETALTAPQQLDLPFGSWTLDRLHAYLQEQKGVGMKRSRIDEILLKEGLRWRQEERWFGVRVDPDFAKKRGPLLTSTKGRRPRASSCVSMS